MKQFLQRLSLRERLLLFGGIALLLISGLYAFLYLPMIDEQLRLKKAIEVQRQLKDYLQSIGAEVAGLQGNSPKIPDATQSLLGIIDSGSEQSAIKPAIKRLVPEGQDKVMLWLERCDFDPLMAWLAVLDNEQGITVQQMAISREQDRPGLVSGKVLLVRQ
jgi:general secretion pathway protein M